MDRKSVGPPSSTAPNFDGHDNIVKADCSFQNRTTQSHDRCRHGCAPTRCQTLDAPRMKTPKVTRNTYDNCILLREVKNTHHVRKTWCVLKHVFKLRDLQHDTTNMSNFFSNTQILMPYLFAALVQRMEHIGKRHQKGDKGSATQAAT